MKNIISFLFFLVMNKNIAQNINFTDSNFKTFLINVTPANMGALNLQHQNVRVDTNYDGEIQVSEAINIKSLNMHGRNISNLTGLEHFINLQILNIANNSISQFHLPALTQLNNLEASNNQISSINLTHYPNISILGMGNNPISNLNVSNLSYLNLLGLKNTQISTLDLRNNPNLTLFLCENSNLSSVMFHPNTQLNFSNSMFLGDCWVNVPLSYVCTGSTQLAALTTFLTNCGHNLSNITINSTCALSVINYDKELVKIYPNPSSTGIFIIKLPNVHNGKVAVFNTLGQVVYYRAFEGQEITLNINHLNKGIYITKITNEIGSTYEEKLVID